MFKSRDQFELKITGQSQVVTKWKTTLVHYFQCQNSKKT